MLPFLLLKKSFEKLLKTVDNGKNKWYDGPITRGETQRSNKKVWTYTNF